MHPEIQRRLVHASGVVIPFSYLGGIITWEHVQLLFVLCMLSAFVLEALRLTGFLQWQIFDTLTREYEHDHVAAYALYMIGTTVVVLTVRPGVAVPALLLLMIADPVIGVLGSGGGLTIKPIRVLATMFALCTLIALPFVHLVPAICGAFAATVADGAKPVIAGYVIDDNLTIPPAAAVSIIAGQQLLEMSHSVGF
ncbi:diacylglycerol/polyprenol kinase family protein [Halocatena pleomorpha]|uniref:Dolichol kinase n=1 Tax=Halocatena pleomorpha TaxID=1785090 RepID=A0A3P3R6R5_9EURY|nr:dolichol kinase [Halocatena pleomorpha]RRJ29151.1 dolichol kinase [Halocatena pleomorpha]